MSSFFNFIFILNFIFTILKRNNKIGDLGARYIMAGFVNLDKLNSLNLNLE